MSPHHKSSRQVISWAPVGSVRLALREKLNIEERTLFSMFQNSSFNQSIYNCRRIELRGLLAELAFQLKKVIPSINRDYGTYDTLIAAANTGSPTVNAVQFSTNIQSAIDLDVYLEHTSSNIHGVEWLDGLNSIKLVAVMISARSLVRLIDDLVQMESENRPRNDFLAKIWLKSEYLNQISAQRQSLINLFINTTGEYIRSQRYKTQRDRTVFKTGDKEAFKSLRKRQVRNILIRRPVKNLELQIENAVQLRGRRRHVFLHTEFTKENSKKDWKILFYIALAIKNDELLEMCQLAMKAYRD